MHRNGSLSLPSAVFSARALTFRVHPPEIGPGEAPPGPYSITGLLTIRKALRLFRQILRLSAFPWPGFDYPACQVDERLKAGCQLAISGCNPAKLLQVCEQVFNKMPCAVGHLVKIEGFFPVYFGRNSCYYVHIGEQVADSVGVVSLVCDEFVGLNAVEKSGQLRGLGGVAWFQDKPDEFAGMVYQCNQFCG